MIKPEVLKLKSYLTVEAQLDFDHLVQLGLDPDLALEIMEKLCGEEIWNLDGEISNDA